ncbi:MAG: pilus assembly protein TadE [Sphingomonadaceae bacterium]|nr:pilus assembly protein TadE [Sphingomonadaceae bacterium]
MFPRLVRDKKGVSVLELALVAPIFLTMTLYGLELVYMAIVSMQVSQIASSLSDNASRLGQTDNSGVTPTVSENEIDTIMGAALRQGDGIDFEVKGRLILSSLEKDEVTDRQYIHWQRCRGSLDETSDYGLEGTGLSGQEIDGMGDPGRIIKAAGANSSAVMFAEVIYDHEGIFRDLFVSDVRFKEQSAFEIRDNRNLEPGVTGAEADSLCS